VEVSAAEGPVEQVTLQWRLTAARSTTPLQQGTHAARVPIVPGRPAEIPFEITLPAEEGVYDFHLARPDAGIEQSRSLIQIVVISPVCKSNSVPVPAEAAGLTEPPGAPAEVPRRWCGPYLEPVVFQRLFPKGGDDADWVSLYGCASQLVARLKASGANSALVAIPAESGPVQHGVIELLYRLFERDGLVLIPELQFSACAALSDSAAVTVADAASLELVYRDGRRWSEVHGGCARFNPLHPMVQESVLATMRDFVERYRNHRSFRGVAVEMTPLQLPGSEWGYDDETVARFGRDTKLAVPEGTASERYEFLTGSARAQWVHWRTAESSRFHRRLAELISSSSADARFIASSRAPRGSGQDGFTAPIDGAHPVRPAEQGIDVQPIQDLDGLVLLHTVRPNRDRWEFPATLRREARGRNEPAVHMRHGLLVHRRLHRDGEAQPAAAQEDNGIAEVPARLSELLAAADLQVIFDADWPVWGGPASLGREFAERVQHLPGIAFHRHESAPQPLLVRIGRTSDKTYLYLLNELPGALSATLHLSCSAETSYRVLHGPAEHRLEKNAAGAALRVALPGFGLYACEIGSPTAELARTSVEVDPAVLAGLRSQIVELASQVAQIQQANRSPLLTEVAERKENVQSWRVPAGGSLTWDWTEGESDDLIITSERVGSEAPPPNHEALSVVHLVIREETAQPTTLLIGISSNGVDRSETVAMSGDGRLKECVVPLKGSAQSGDGSVCVENKGPGAVRVETVEVRSYAVTPDDLRELTKSLSALSLAWDEKRYADCHRLLNSARDRCRFEERSVTPRDSSLLPAEAEGEPNGFESRRAGAAVAGGAS
jgi:hypothetical protein